MLLQTRVAWSVAPRRERTALAESVALGFTERVALACAALALAPSAGGGIATAAALALVATALFAARRLLRATARIAIEAELQRRGVRAVLARHPFEPRARGEPDAQTLTMDGAYAGAVLVAESATGACADGAAAVVVAVILVFTQPPRVLVLGLLALGVALGVAALTRRRMRHVERQVLTTYEPVVEHLRAAIQGRVEIVTRGVSEAHLAATDAAVAAHARAAIRADRVGALLGRAPLALGVAAVGVVLVLDGTAARALHASASGDASAWAGSAAAIAAALPAFVGALAAMMQITRGEVAFAPMALWLRPTPPSDVSAGKHEGKTPIGVLEWRDVHARYPGAANDALSAASATWPPGKVLLVMGANGAGKSTLLRTLIGLVDVTDGALTAGETALDAEMLAAWRPRMAYLPQEPWLGDQCSVRQAFHWLEPDATDPVITSALERVGLLDALESKGDPLSVRVSELSAGQRQRIALARVLMREADVLLLDEPDTNLDARGVELLAALLLERASVDRVAVAAHSPRLIAALASRAVEVSL